MIHRIHLPRLLTVLSLGLLAPLSQADPKGEHKIGAEGAPPLGYSPANMDRTVSPRRDFYRYADGRWLDRTPIPPSEPDVGGFSLLAANLDQQLLQLIQSAASQPAPAGSPAQQIGDYWRAAMDTQRLDERGLQPLRADLDRVAAWGTDGRAQALAAPAALGSLSGRLQMGYGASPFLNAEVGPDAKDSKRHLLALTSGVQTLEQSQYLDAASQPLRELYRNYITRMFTAAGEAQQAAAAQADTVLELEAELVRARLKPIDFRDPAKIYNKMSLDEAQALVPALDLRAHLAAAGLATPPQQVQVVDVAGFKALQQLLSTRPAADLRTLLRWHVLTARASALGQPWYGLAREFARQRQGLQVAPTRERELTQAMGTQLFHPLSQLYVQRYFPERTRRDILQMVQHIRGEFEHRLRTNPWLDEPTRAAALDKLSKIDIQVGYPQNWIDFSSVLVQPDDHFGNVQRIGAFLIQRDFDRLNQPVVPDRFAAPRQTTPIAVNAAYDPQSNTIDITAAIVQPPFYKPGADAAVNYCTIGAVIGHELTHGFDSNGRQYGPAGNLRDWWTPQAASEFKKRTDVLVQQYSAFTLLPGVQHNGDLTLTENTADLGGITLANAALHRALAGQPQPRIDGLSTDQRCFVAWAQMWAYQARPERTKLLAAIDYHANSGLRAFAPLLHLDAFHRAFGTRPGDPMWRAPQQRVVIW